MSKTPKHTTKPDLTEREAIDAVKRHATPRPAFPPVQPPRPAELPPGEASRDRNADGKRPVPGLEPCKQHNGEHVYVRCNENEYHTYCPVTYVGCPACFQWKNSNPQGRNLTAVDMTPNLRQNAGEQPKSA